MVRPTIVRRRNRFSFRGACLSRHGRRGSRRQAQMQIPARLKSLPSQAQTLETLRLNIINC